MLLLQKKTSDTKETYKKLNYNKLWNPTGDPFVDAGGYALKFLSEQFPEMDLLDLIIYATDIYVDKWNAKINTFFLNSNITQPSFKPSEKKSNTKKYFSDLLNNSIPYQTGVCRIIGHETELFPVGRHLSVLSGSGRFVNFHHSFEKGLMLSKEAIIRYHFLPLACELLQANICVIGCSNPIISEYYSKSCCSKNQYLIGMNQSDGVLKNSAKSQGTALFRFVDSLLSDLPDCQNNITISLYHFTNFGASPDLTIYTLPLMAFFFYRETQKRQYKDTWNAFVNSYYRNSEYKNLSFNKETSVFIGLEKKNEVEIQESDYKYWRNIIYDKLLNNVSILQYIRKWSIENNFSIELLNCYLINIRYMKQETLSKLNQIADFILQNTKEVDMKKTLTKLNGINSAYLLRRFILKVVEKNYVQGNPQPIITVEDYTDYLFPETGSWLEMRDVLLIYLYQKLHEQNKLIKMDDIELTDDEPIN